MRPLIVVLALLFAWPVLAQQPKPLPPGAVDSINEALRILQDIKASKLEPHWRAAALARAARTIGRTADADLTQELARDAALALREPVTKSVPEAMSPGIVEALLAQAYADVRNGEMALTLARQAAQDVSGLSDAGIRASFGAYAGQVMIQAGDRAGAGEALLAALRSASQTPSGRERISALVLIVQAQARLGDLDTANSILAAARESIGSVPEGLEKALATALIARGEAAVRNVPAARTRSRESTQLYDKAGLSPETPPALRFNALAAIALAQAESGDKTSARQTSAVLRQVADAIQQPYERFVAQIAAADTILQVER